MRVFLYIRVSTSEQAKEGYSIGEQEQRLRAYCKAKGWKIAKVFTDGGYSGGNTSRPALTELLSAVQKHQADAILVYKLDRLSRSQKDTLTLIDTFLQNNCDFISMTENFDTSSPFGRATIGMLSVFAQLEREQIKERMSMGKEGRAKEGKYHGGGISPIGYEYKDGHLVVNEFEAMQVREMHRLFQSGMPFRIIARTLESKGSRYYEARSVKRTLKNPLYIGKIKHNDTLYPGEHEPIIDEETYNKTMELLNALPTGTKPSKTYLGGLIVCAHCGAKYTINTVHDTRYNRKYKYYACHSRRKTNKSLIKNPNCQNKIYKVKELDEIIFNEIRKLSIEKNFRSVIKKSDSDNSVILNREIAKLENQKSRLMDLYSIGTFTIEDIQKKIIPIQEQIDKLSKQINVPSTPEETAHELIQSFDDVLKNGNHDEIKMVIDSLIDKIEIDGEDIAIYWAFV